MLSCIKWEIIPDVSKRRNPLIFRIKQSLDYFTLKKKVLYSTGTSLFTSPHGVHIPETSTIEDSAPRCQISATIKPGKQR